MPDYAARHLEEEEHEGLEEEEGRIIIPPDIAGRGWFDPRLSTLTQGVDLCSGILAEPRTWDQQPGDVPPDHSFRAIVKVFDESPLDSDIYVKASLLSDELAIDLILHYGATRNVFVIMNYVDPGVIRTCDEKKAAYDAGRLRYLPAPANSVSKIMAFLQDHASQNSYTLFQRVKIRVANILVDGVCQYGKSSMHENMILTDNHVANGSYDLSPYARCKNWESIRVVPPVAKRRGEVRPVLGKPWRESRDYKSLCRCFWLL